MIWQLAKRELRDRKLSLIIYCLSTLLFIWLYVSIYPSIKASSAQFTELLKHFPKEVLQAFGRETLNFNSFENYIAAEQFNFVWPIIYIILILSRAGNSIAAEIENRTMGLLLSLPLPRPKIFVAKVSSGLLTIGIFLTVSVFGVIPFIAAYHIDVHLRPYALLWLLGWCFGLSVYGLSLFFSAAFQERSKAYFVSAGCIFLMYVMNIVAQLQPSLSWLRYGSIFHFADFQQVLTANVWPWTGSAILLVFGLILTLLAAILFSKKDLSV